MTTISGIRPGSFGDRHWKAPVANAASLPPTGNLAGDTRKTLDDQHEHVWTGSAWVDETVAGSQGPTGPAGADGATWTSGTGAPSGGSDGDFYLRTSSGDVYRRASGSWSVIANITGPTGPQGPAGAGGSSAASPLDYSSNLVFWLNAETLAGSYSDGDTVASFPDSGTGGNDFSAFNCIFRTTGMVVPAVQFNGASSYLSRASVALSSFSVFLVFACSNAGVIYEHSADSDAFNGSRLYSGNNYTINVHRTQSSSRDLSLVDHNGSASGRYWAGDSQWHVVMHEFQGTFRRHRLYVDGAYPPMINVSSSGPLTGTVTDAFYIGCRAGSAAWADMLLTDFICMSPSLPASDEEKVIAFLKQKDSL